MEAVGWVGRCWGGFAIIQGVFILGGGFPGVIVQINCPGRNCLEASFPGSGMLGGSCPGINCRRWELSWGNCPRCKLSRE